MPPAMTPAMTPHPLQAVVRRRRRRWALIALVALLAGAAGLFAAMQSLHRIAPGPAPAVETLAQTLDRRLQRGSPAAAGIAIRPLHAGQAPAVAPTAGSASLPPGPAVPLSGSASPSPRAAAAAAATAAAATSTVVTAGDAAVLAESLCDALAARLVRGAGMRVVPCTSTRAAVASALDDAGLARLVGVRYVLSGSVQAVGPAMLHVRLALRDAGAAAPTPPPTSPTSATSPAWQLDEQMPAAALQALPARVAQETGRAIGQAGSADAARDEVLIPEQAYLDHLRASQLARRPTVPDKLEAYRLVEQVLGAAPDYEPAQYLRLGLASVLSTTGDGPASQGDLAQVQAAQRRLRDDIRALGERMVARDPASWRGRILLLNDAFAHGRWPEAFMHADALAQHTARHPGVLRIAARLYLSAGYLRQAQALALDAARLNALDAEAYEVLAMTHAALGEADAFAETLALAVQMGHRRVSVPQALLALRRNDAEGFAAAARAFATTAAGPAAWAEPWLRGVLAPGERAAATAALLGIGDDERLKRAELLLEWVLLGDTERAAAALQHVAARPVARWIEDLWWPELAALRRHAAFAPAAERIGLVALWAQRGAPDLCAGGTDGAWACR